MTPTFLFAFGVLTVVVGFLLGFVEEIIGGLSVMIGMLVSYITAREIFVADEHKARR